MLTLRLFILRWRVDIFHHYADREDTAAAACSRINSSSVGNSMLFYNLMTSLVLRRFTCPAIL